MNKFFKVLFTELNKLMPTPNFIKDNQSIINDLQEHVNNNFS